jgi:ankyrin repeat protein
VALAELSADLNAQDGDGLTPLLHAAMRNHVPTVQALLDRGADINRAGGKGYQPLALSIAESKFEVAKTLLDKGAAVDDPAGSERLTPLMIAASQVAPGEGGRFLPGNTRPIDLARELITRGANVNAQSIHGVTPLMIAAARNVAPMIGLLVQSGADPNLKSDEGKTALQIAEQNGADAAAKALKLIGKAADGSSN